MENLRETASATDQTELALQLAKGHGFDLYQQYSENRAAEFLGFKPATLKRRRLAGQIACVRKGERKVTYFGFQMAEFLIQSIEPCKTTYTTEPSKSVITGSAKTPEAQRGAEHGMTPQPSRQDALACAQRILTMPRSD